MQIEQFRPQNLTLRQAYYLGSIHKSIMFSDTAKIKILASAIVLLLYVKKSINALYERNRKREKVTEIEREVKPFH